MSVTSHKVNNFLFAICTYYKCVGMGSQWILMSMLTYLWPGQVYKLWVLFASVYVWKADSISKVRKVQITSGDYFPVG